MSSGPNKQASQLRELGDEELRTRLGEAKQELFNLRFQSVTGQLDNNRRLRTVRHDIARIYSVMRERELGIAPAPLETVDEGAAGKKALKPAAKAADEAAAQEKSEVSA